MRSTIIHPTMLVVLPLVFTWLFLFFERTSGVLPTGNLHYLEDYLCWPYNASVYSTDEVKMDSAFHRYPLDSYFSEGEELGRTRWTKYNEIDIAEWYGMDSTLKRCNDNADLYDALMRRDPVYFAGTYRLEIVANGRRKQVYERILFLNVNQKRLHIFKDINKVL